MPEIRTALLFTIALTVAPGQAVGATPLGQRLVVPVTGGRFEGPRLKGRVLPGGADWILVDRDGTVRLDVRLTLETEDGALITMAYRGYRHGPEEVIRRVNRGEPVDPAAYYFRTAPSFETAAERYAWLNRIVAVATGRRTEQGPVYEVYEVL